MECNWCKKDRDKLYEHKGWMVCWDCYFEDIDKTLGKEEIERLRKYKKEREDCFLLLNGYSRTFNITSGNNLFEQLNKILDQIIKKNKKIVRLKEEIAKIKTQTIGGSENDIIIEEAIKIMPPEEYELRSP